MKLKNGTKGLDRKSNDRLYLEFKSSFAPKNYKDLNPKGFKIFTFHSGFKKKNDDLLVIVFEKNINVACKYSLTTTPSAPIIWDKKHNKGQCRALIVNSGNANAHTGAQGLKNINKYTKQLAKLLSCSISEILVSSTGVIGEQFDPNLICKKLKFLKISKEKKLIDAARAIGTTDTFVKTSVHNLKIDNQNVNCYGFAKGSGMINPNMATMLAYIFIDCYPITLKKLLTLLLLIVILQLVIPWYFFQIL
jgi:glutamate N-acetyltransferase/amino-acid N-acetyltransferase